VWAGECTPYHSGYCQNITTEIAIKMDSFYQNMKSSPDKRHVKEHKENELKRFSIHRGSCQSKEGEGTQLTRASEYKNLKSFSSRSFILN
jgi:hypothetical protein